MNMFSRMKKKSVIATLDILYESGNTPQIMVLMDGCKGIDPIYSDNGRYAFKVGVQQVGVLEYHEEFILVNLSIGGNKTNICIFYDSIESIEALDTGFYCLYSAKVKEEIKNDEVLKEVVTRNSFNPEQDKIKRATSLNGGKPSLKLV